jgi:predicted pyridoxine 5'-phosphate oxidase superfamily flavin-nucleotide-binding protein
MSALPEIVVESWENRKGAPVFTTVSKDGICNSVYVTCVSLYNKETIIIADNYFNKTRQNILDGSRGVFLFITESDKAYQIKGKIEYLKEGKLFDDMKSWNPERHPGHAAVILRIEEVYSGADKLV